MLPSHHRLCNSRAWGMSLRSGCRLANEFRYIVLSSASPLATFMVRRSSTFRMAISALHVLAYRDMHVA